MKTLLMTKLTWPRLFHFFFSCKIWYPKKNDNGSDVGVENCGLKTYCLNCMCPSCRSWFVFGSGVMAFILFFLVEGEEVCFPVGIFVWFPSVFSPSVCMVSKTKNATFKYLLVYQNDILKGKWIHLESTKNPPKPKKKTIKIKK